MRLTKISTLCCILIIATAWSGCTALSPIDATPDSGELAPATIPIRAPDDRSEWHDPTLPRRLAQSYLAESEVEPTLTDDERESIEPVLALVATDELQAAANLLDGIRGAAASAVFDFQYGNVRFQQDRLEEAERAYRTAVDKYPKFVRAWRNLGQIQFRRGDFEGAATSFARVLELGRGDAVTYGLLGVAHSRTDNPIAAESAFRNATMLDPNSVDWQKGLAESFFRQGRFADAASLFDTLIRDEPDRAEYWLAQGEAYARLGQPMDAAENFELVDDLGGSTVDSLSNLGDIYANEQLFDLAVDAYQRALAKFEGTGLERPVRAAKFLSASGARREARILVDAIEHGHRERLAPEQHKDLLKIRARLAAADGASDEEARALQEIVELDPLDGEALILLGQHAARDGDSERAVFYLERAGNLPSFEADAKVRHAQLLVGKGDYAAAIPLLHRAQSLKPRDNIQQYLDQVERIARQQ